MDNNKRALVPLTLVPQVDHSSVPLLQSGQPVDTPDNLVECWELIMQIGASRETVIRIGLVGQVVLGRSDSKSNARLHLDLTPYGAHLVGVSRRHAAINASQGRLYIRDLESRNGTQLNGVTLIPAKPYPFQPGDELRLGGLRLTLCIACPATAYVSSNALTQ